MGLGCSLGRSALHSDLKHFGKSQNKQEKPTKLGLQLDFGLEQCVTSTSSKLYFPPEVSPCLSLRGSFSMEKRLL